VVARFYIVRDCGQIINPDGLRNQIEGNIVQTVSRSLKEKVTFDRSMVTSLDWASSPILTFPEIPDVVIELIDRPDQVPWGGGEPSAAIVPAAISNAVFEATGAGLRSVPFTPAKVKAAVVATQSPSIGQNFANDGNREGDRCSRLRHGPASTFFPKNQRPT
jgi:nicotinate dehydrogenase subunit B